MKRSLLYLLIIGMMVLPPLISCGRKIGPENSLLLVPKETGTLISINITKLAKTGLYQDLIKDEARLAEYNRFIADTGIDPLKDLTKLLIIIPENSGKIGESVSIGFGSIEKDKIIANLKKKGTLTEETYLGVTIYRLAGSERRINISFLGEGVIATGSIAPLKEVIKLFKRKGETIQENPELMELIDRINQADTIWAVSMIPPDWKKKFASFPLTFPFASLRSFLFSLNTEKEEIRLVLVGKAETGGKAKEIANTITGLLGIGRMGVEGKPALSDLLDKIEIESIEEFITLSLNATKEELDLAKGELSGEIERIKEGQITLPKQKEK